MSVGVSFKWKEVVMAMFRNGPGSPFAVGVLPTFIATADVNGDGHLDLLVSTENTDRVAVLLGDGHGGFVAAAPVAVGAGPQEVEAGDLDGDGDIDFVVSNFSGNTVSVELNN